MSIEYFLKDEFRLRYWFHVAFNLQQDIWKNWESFLEVKKVNIQIYWIKQQALSPSFLDRYLNFGSVEANRVGLRNQFY